jgi:SNF2 family DNA or RNA helicase
VSNNINFAQLRAERDAARKRQQRADAAVENDLEWVKSFPLHGIAFDHQITSAAMFYRKYLNFQQSGKGGMLDASTVGMGKTYSAAAFLLKAQAPSTLWITKKSLIFQTAKKLTELGLTVMVLNKDTFEMTSDMMNSLGLSVVYIVNYEMIRDSKVAGKHVPSPFINYKHGWDILICDEVTKIKNGASPKPPALFENMKHLIKKHNPFRLFLSGTPSENHPREVWSYLHLFDAERFGSWQNFERAFCNAQWMGGALNLDKMLELLSGHVIRHTPKSIGMSMQTQNIYVEACELTGEVELAYKRLLDEFAIWLDNQNDSLNVTMVLEQLLRQRQLLQTGKTFRFNKTVFDDMGNPIGKVSSQLEFSGPYPKLDVAEEKIISLQAEGEQVIVFSCFNQPLQDLAERFGPFLRTAIINGDTRNHAEIQEEFQQGNIDVLFINKLSGSQGLNLQKCDDWPGGASYVIHLDKWWNPAIEEQCNGRVQRINTNAPTFVYYLHVDNTVDDFMQALVERKQQMNDTLSDGVTVDKSFVRSYLGLS